MGLINASKAVDQKFSLMAGNEAQLLAVTQGMESQLLSQVMSFYETQKDQIAGLTAAETSQKVSGQVNRFRNKLTKSITSNKDYRSSLKAYTRTFDKLDGLNHRIHSNISEVDISDVIQAVGPAKSDIISGLDLSLVGQGMDTNFSDPVKKILFQNLVNGTGISKARDQLREFITGNEERLGHLRRYTSQVTRDALNQYDGTLNDAVKKRFKMNAWRYLGTLIDDSRPQCERWITDPKFNRILMDKDLPAEISWASINGRGHIPGTDSSNFGQLRGGYNCRHQAIPFRKREAKPAKPVEPGEAKPLTVNEAKGINQGFTPLKTVKEAENFLREKGVRVADLSGWKIDNANAMAKAVANTPREATPDVIGSFTKVQDSRSRKFSKQENRNFGVNFTRSQIKVDTVDLTPGVRAQLSKDKIDILDSKFTDQSTLFGDFNVVGINTRVFKTPGAITARKSQVNDIMIQRGQGRYFMPETEGFTHFHELGHVFDNNLAKFGRVENLRFRQAFTDLHKKWFKESGLAHLSSEREAFADAFADYFGNQGENLPDDILALFNQNF